MGSSHTCVSSLLLLLSFVNLVRCSLSETTEETILQIIDIVKSSQEESQPSMMTRPHLTLSFAQSLDGKLAPFGGTEGAANYPLSGRESLRMTHALRSIHDGILIGGRTLSIDNPRLTNRLWSQGKHNHQPRPIVLDPELKHVHRSLRAERLLVFCSHEAAHSRSVEIPDGCEFVPCRLLENGHLDLVQVLSILKSQYNISSLMVEGGARILDSFLKQGLFDCICVTVTPVFLGPGISLMLPHPTRFASDVVTWKHLNADSIFLTRKNDISTD